MTNANIMQKSTETDYQFCFCGRIFQSIKKLTGKFVTLYKSMVVP